MRALPVALTRQRHWAGLREGVCLKIEYGNTLFLFTLLASSTTLIGHHGQPAVHSGPGGLSIKPPGSSRNAKGNFFCPRQQRRKKERMSSINKVFILGHLGKDPEVRYAPSGAAICNITIATSRSWKDKNSGEKVEETEWHRVVMYDRLAEVAGQYLKKGKPVHIEGRLKTLKWTDKDGTERYTTEIIANEMTMLGGREDSEAQQGSRGGNAQAPQRQTGATSQQREPAQQPQGRSAPPARQPAPAGFDDMDDDIPF